MDQYILWEESVPRQMNWQYKFACEKTKLQWETDQDQASNQTFLSVCFYWREWSKDHGPNISIYHEGRYFGSPPIAVCARGRGKGLADLMTWPTFCLSLTHTNMSWKSQPVVALNWCYITCAGLIDLFMKGRFYFSNFISSSWTVINMTHWHPLPHDIN